MANKSKSHKHMGIGQSHWKSTQVANLSMNYDGLRVLSKSHPESLENDLALQCSKLDLWSAEIVF